MSKEVPSETQEQKTVEGKHAKTTGSTPRTTEDKHFSWLDPSVDMRKNEPFHPGDMPHPLLTESSFATLFPRHKEAYLKEVWPLVTKELEKLGISAKLDLFEGSMTVSTTRRTWDPYAIVNARDFIKLLSRAVPYKQALRIFEDEIFCDIVKIKGYCNTKEQFVKRRQRLIGPEGQTLKAIELLTQCYVLVQGNTVAIMGKWNDIKQVREIVVDCMNNIHPVYNIKTLMVKRELSKYPNISEENWERFVPKFKKQNVKTKKPKTKKKKKYSPFPPAPTPRTVDLQLESGEYFMKKSEKEELHRKKKIMGEIEKAKEKKEMKEKEFVPPKESKTPTQPKSEDIDIKSTIENIKKGEKEKKRKTSANVTADDFLLPS